METDWALDFKDMRIQKSFMKLFYADYTYRQMILGIVVIPLLILNTYGRCQEYAEVCSTIIFENSISFVLSILSDISILFFPIRGRKAYWIYGIAPVIGSIFFLHQESLVGTERLPENHIISIWAHSILFRNPLRISIVNGLFAIACYVVFTILKGGLNLQDTIRLMILTFTGNFLGIMAEYLKRKSFYFYDQAEAKSIALQKKRSELKILLNRLLPERIANQLLTHTEQHVAEMHEQCTVIFIGLNDFNEEDLVDLVDDKSKKDLFTFLEWMFTLIDRKAEEFGVEKIKTTSATWLGIVKSRKDQQTRATTFALAVMDLVKKDRTTLPMTCGISDGPVIGCVLGKLKPVYDVISDTVNTTHRLYSKGPVNGVCVTREFADKLSDIHDFIMVEEKGEVVLKGKGVKDLVFLTTKEFEPLNSSPKIRKLRAKLELERDMDMDEESVKFEEEVKIRVKEGMPFSQVIGVIFEEFRTQIVLIYVFQFVVSVLMELTDYIFVLKPRGMSITGPLMNVGVSLAILGVAMYQYLHKRKPSSLVAYLMFLGLIVRVRTKFVHDQATMEFFRPGLFIHIFQYGMILGVPEKTIMSAIVLGYALILATVRVMGGVEMMFLLLVISVFAFISARIQIREMSEIARKRKAVEDISAEIEKETERFEGALDSLIPKSLRALLTDEKNFVTFHTCVMFADVVNFTEYSSLAGADDTVKLLDDVYECIDKISVRRNMSRFKLIGDAYVACGIEGIGDNTSNNAYEAAQEIMKDLQQIMERYRHIHDGINLRIGLAAGTVSAGLIGREASRTVYDIYGGCIEEAEKCQKAAMPGEIYVSEDTRKSLNH